MKASRSILVGVFLIGGLVLFAVGLFLIGSEKNLFTHHFDVYAYFSNVNGLDSGAKVHVSGLDAGSISDIRIPSATSGRFRVKMSVDRKFRPLVRQNSVASISSQGMVGDEFIEIDPASNPGPECSGDCTIQSTEPLTISDLLKQGQGVMKTLNSTLSSAGDAAKHADQAISTFDAREKGGETGPERLRQTVANAQAAANNVAEDAEALKHNFFLRGFFKHRGFYSLAQMSAEQYRKSDFVKEKKSKRVWLAADKLFTDAHGKEELAEEGKKALDMAMSDFTSYLPNKPLMVEGYADRGSPADEYRKSEQRAELVRDYLASRFQLKPQYTGTMPLSDSPPEQSGQSNWDGVSLVILT